MYDEDMYLPTSDENELVSNKTKTSKTMKQIVSEMYLENKKGYHKIIKNIRGKKVVVELFASGARGTTIQNAVSGDRYNGHLVGSKDEEFYYKVNVCTGEITGREMCTLFYDSPEQYEKHMMVSVNSVSKELWHKKQIR
jgi:uncharacterized protein YbcI